MVLRHKLKVIHKRAALTWCQIHCVCLYVAMQSASVYRTRVTTEQHARNSLRPTASGVAVPRAMTENCVN